MTGRESLDGERGVKKLAYFKRIREKRAWTARVTILVIILGLLVLNVYLMFVSMSTVVLNIDMARIEQSDQADLIHARIARIERHVADMEERQLALLPEGVPHEPAPAVETPPSEQSAVAVAESP